MARVVLKSIGKNFGSVNVLRDIDLEIEDGEFVVLVGPSGCGKSTLLRLIAGLEEITSGTLEINGKVMNDVEARERDIAMVFQSYALYPHMSVERNIGFPLTVRKQDPQQIAQDVERVAALTGLPELLERKPKQLSGGQRQRVAMGRAIIRDPKVFLFDEPLSNLDAKLRVQMRQQIRDLHRRVTATSIYVTHDQVEAMTLADRVVLMRDGDIQQIGAPMELYERPANMFVAGFIGSPEMNLMDGVVCSNGDRLVIALSDGSEIAVPTPIADALKVDQPIVFGIRPEHLKINSDGIAARVIDYERLGAETRVFARAGEQDITCVLYGSASPDRNEEIKLTPDLARIHVFDAKSQVRLG